MSIKKFKESELILNPDGSIYHLKLKPENIADTIIVVGDPKRVPGVSKFFDAIEFKQENRELVTHTGTFNKKRLTALSTGMGPDNIDIVINELDALVNIDLEKRVLKDKVHKLNIIRLGTSGALQADIPVDSFVASTHGLGIDGVLNFYKVDEGLFDEDIASAFVKHTNWSPKLARPYVAKGSAILMKKVAHDFLKGVTATAGGFFGPQGRELRMPLAFPELNEKIESFRFGEHRITNFEMETSALYGLGKIMGHEMLTVCVIIANRITKKYSGDYKPHMERLIKTVLERITS
jgi:uridine phosphorylase